MQDQKKELPRKSQYSFEDLLTLVRILRAPGGCPWDREQTHKSVRRNLLEETYEVAEGIDLDDPRILREELGDYLFQAALHMVMEEEAGRFTPEDVLHDICKKMILRHPHVFGGSAATEDATAVAAGWEEQKKQEKGQRTVGEALSAVPRTLPALMYAKKLSSRAADFGFSYAGAEQAGEKVCEEWRELAAAQGEAEREEELGDLLFAIVNYARLLGVDAEEALAQSSRKFAKRLVEAEGILSKEGKILSQCTREEMYAAWQKAKNCSFSTKKAKI